MLLHRTERLPEGPNWLYELKLDGYRAIAVKSGGKSPNEQAVKSRLREMP
jgi:ATP-dependent DNA ligase